MTAYNLILAPILIGVDFGAQATGGKGTALGGVSFGVEFSVMLDVVHKPLPPPAGTEPVYWRRLSETYPDPVAYRNGRPNPDVFKPSSTVASVLGRAAVFVNGSDVTYAGGLPAQVTDWATSEPWGWESAVVQWEHLTPLNSAGFLVPGASFDLSLVSQAGAHVRYLFRGFIAEVDGSDTGVRVMVLGTMKQASLDCHQPPFFPSMQDIGTSIPDALNGVVSRRYAAVARVVTGISTAQRGTRSDTVSSYCQSMLAMSTTDDGLNMWTVSVGQTCVPTMRLKDRTTVNWTVTFGQRGVDVSLATNLLEDPNVVYGSGIDPNRERWSNSRWPGSTTSQAPLYPNSSPSNTMVQGETDADTGNGKGITQLQSRLRALGFTVPIDGIFGSTTKTAVKAFQRSVSILVDGIIGGQTWNALWPIKGSLGTPFFMPIAFDDTVMPYLYAADGTITGKNPAYNPHKMRVEKYYAFGDGVGRVTAIRWATALMARNAAIPSLTGNVTLEADPREGSRYLIEAGQNIRVRGWGSAAGPLLHIARCGIRNSGQVSLTVDSRAQDLMTLDAIAARRREIDPAQRILTTAKESQTEPDLSPWMSEPPAGVVPKTALWRNLWSVMAIPMGPYGQVVRTLLNCSGPNAGFAVAVFSRSVTSNKLASLIGNPLASDASGWGKLANNLEPLENLGYLIGWGQSGQAMGYSPGQTSPTGGAGKLTGKFQEDSPFEYACQDGAYLWLAIYADRSTFVSGRLYVVLPYQE